MSITYPMYNLHSTIFTTWTRKRRQEGERETVILVSILLIFNSTWQYMEQVIGFHIAMSSTDNKKTQPYILASLCNVTESLDNFSHMNFLVGLFWNSLETGCKINIKHLSAWMESHTTLFVGRLIASLQIECIA